MTNYSIQQIKSVGQPPEVLNRRVAEHWSGPLYMRKISPYVSKVLLKLGISPTLVTWLMVVSGWLAAASVSSFESSEEEEGYREAVYALLSVSHVFEENVSHHGLLLPSSKDFINPPGATIAFAPKPRLV